MKKLYETADEILADLDDKIVDDADLISNVAKTIDYKSRSIGFGLRYAATLIADSIRLIKRAKKGQGNFYVDEQTQKGDDGVIASDKQTMLAYKLSLKPSDAVPTGFKQIKANALVEAWNKCEDLTPQKGKTIFPVQVAAAAKQSI